MILKFKSTLFDLTIFIVALKNDKNSVFENIKTNERPKLNKSLKKFKKVEKAQKLKKLEIFKKLKNEK